MAAKDGKTSCYENVQRADIYTGPWVKDKYYSLPFKMIFDKSDALRFGYIRPMLFMVFGLFRSIEKKQFWLRSFFPQLIFSVSSLKCLSFIALQNQLAK